MQRHIRPVRTKTAEQLKASAPWAQDVSPMKGVRIDSGHRVATVQAGLTWGELDRKTQRFGLAVTSGLVSTTGIAGFTLIPYVELQSLIDHAWGPGARNYFKSGYLDTVGDDPIDQLLRAHVNMSSPKAEIHFHRFGGAAARVAPDETAFGDRSSYVLNLCNRWLDPDETDEHIDWARTAHERLSPFLTGGVYVNFLADEGANQAQAASGDKYQRFSRNSDRYDPTNVFRLNQNITPSQL